MRKAIEITEWCPHCNEESEYGYTDESEIKGVEQCNHCNKKIALCSVCKEQQCSMCENGSKFELLSILY